MVRKEEMPCPQKTETVTEENWKEREMDIYNANPQPWLDEDSDDGFDDLE